MSDNLLPPNLRAVLALAGSMALEFGLEAPEGLRDLLPREVPEKMPTAPSEYSIRAEPVRERKPRYRHGAGSCHWCGCTIGRVAQRCMNRACEKFNQPREAR